MKEPGMKRPVLKKSRLTFLLTMAWALVPKLLLK